MSNERRFASSKKKISYRRLVMWLLHRPFTPASEDENAYLREKKLYVRQVF